MGNLHIQETFVNRTENVGIGGTDIYTTFTDDIGELFKTLRTEFGKATCMYVGEGEGVQVGWVFLRKLKYDDSKETFLREVWVEVYEKDEAGEYHRYDFTKKKKKERLAQ